MKLLIAAGLFPPEIGGPATYAKLFEERLPSFGIDVEVLPFRVVRHLPLVIRHIVYAWKIVGRARASDAILVQDTVSTGFPAAIASLIVRKPLILRVPGDYAWEQGVQRFGVKENLDDFQKKSYGFAVSTLRAIQRFVVNRARRVIVPSKYLGRIVSGWFSYPMKVNVIYNGVDIANIPVQSRESNLIVSSGRLVPWKGFMELINILAWHRDWRLVIVGDGPDRDALEEHADARGVEGRVTFVGQTSHEEAQRWFARATVFVLNSKYEGFSHTLIEAMACGTPVIATRVGGNPETINIFSEHILIEAGDSVALEKALELMLGDIHLRQKVGEAAKRRARDFSIDKTVEATASLIKSCTS